MTDSVERTMEAEPLKGGQEEANVSNGRGCTSKPGIGKLSGWRTAAFLLSVFICLSVIFAFSFILPCPVRPQYQPTWNVTLHDAVTYNFLAIADASKDKVLDVIFIYKSNEGIMNHTCSEEGLSSRCLFLLAVDGTDGHSLWERPLSAEFDWAQCGLGGDKKFCLVAHDGLLTSIDIYTGMILWQRTRSVVADGHLPVISLPDLNNDEMNDFAVLSYSPELINNLTRLVFFSGKLGNTTGSPVDEVVRSKQILSHLQYTTSSGAQYLLLHTDKGLYAVGLWRFAGRANLDAKLKQEKTWEKRADDGFVLLYESESLKGVFKVEGKSASILPPLLLHTDSSVILLNMQTLAVTWSINTSNLLSAPSFGHYNKDDVLDIVLEEDLKNATKRVVIIDGQTGGELWQVHLMFLFPNPRPASVLTINFYSVFMVWGKQSTYSNSTSSFDAVNEKRSTYLLHPLHSDVLLEKRNSAQNIITFKATLLERGRHACYLILTGSNGTQIQGEEPVVLTKKKVKGDISKSSVLKVEGADGVSEDVSLQSAESVKETFHRMRFSDVQ